MVDILIEYHDSLDPEDESSHRLIIDPSEKSVIDAYTLPNNWSRVTLGTFFWDQGKKKGRSSVSYVPFTPVIIHVDIDESQFDDLDGCLREAVDTPIFRMYEQNVSLDGQISLGRVEYQLWFKKFDGDVKKYPEWTFHIRNSIISQMDSYAKSVLESNSKSNMIESGSYSLDSKILHPTYRRFGHSMVISELVSSFHSEPADPKIIFPDIPKKPSAMKVYAQQRDIKERTNLADSNSEIRIICKSIPMKDVYEKIAPGSTIGKKWICPVCKKELFKLFEEGNRANCFPDDGGCGYHADSIQLLKTCFGYDPIPSFKWFHDNFKVQDYGVESDYIIDSAPNIVPHKSEAKREDEPEDGTYPWDDD